MPLLFSFALFSGWCSLSSFLGSVTCFVSEEASKEGRNTKRVNTREEGWVLLLNPSFFLLSSRFEGDDQHAEGDLPLKEDRVLEASRERERRSGMSCWNGSLIPKLRKRGRKRRMKEKGERKALQFFFFFSTQPCTVCLTELPPLVARSSKTCCIFERMFLIVVVDQT